MWDGGWRECRRGKGVEGEGEGGRVFIHRAVLTGGC